MGRGGAVSSDWEGLPSGESLLAGRLQEADPDWPDRCGSLRAAALSASPLLRPRRGPGELNLHLRPGAAVAAMGLRLCPYRAALLPSGLLFLLMLADPALPAGRPPPVVLGEARVQSWVRSLVRAAWWVAGGAVFQLVMHLLQARDAGAYDCLVT